MTASALIAPPSPWAPPEIPEPKADQAWPSHLAMLVTASPPAVAKSPPTLRLRPLTASASTIIGYGFGQAQPQIPDPTADQPLPSHLAMLVAATPPALMNPPPA